MSWVVTLIASCLGMLVGGMGMFALANVWVKWFKVSSFEGASGYFVIAQSILGGIVGFVVSLFAARVAYASFGNPWYIQVGSSLTAVVATLAIVLVASYPRVDRVPTIDGFAVDMIWEIRLQVAGSDAFAPSTAPQTWPNEELKLELVSVSNHRPRGSRQATFDRSAFREEDGQWILTCRIPLFTNQGEFCVNLTLGGRDDGFWPPIRPVSHSGTFEWSSWLRTNKGNKQSNDRSATMYRFKFERTDRRPLEQDNV